MKKEKIRINFDAPKELIDKAKETAEAKYMTLSALIRLALETYLKGE